MKKLIRVALWALLGIALIWVFTPQIPAVIVHGESEIYTREDRQAAARLISDTVNSFEGCKLYAVKYEGDEVSQKNLEYCNSLADDGVTYSETYTYTELEYRGYTAQDVREITIKHSYLNRFLSYNEWRISVEFKKEPNIFILVHIS